MALALAGARCRERDRVAQAVSVDGCWAEPAGHRTVLHGGFHFSHCKRSRTFAAVIDGANRRWAVDRCMAEHAHLMAGAE